MGFKEIIEETEPKLKNILSDLGQELAKIRTHRPSTELIEDLKVDCFGKKVPLKSLGMISLGQEKEIMIKPWDPSYLESIEKAIYNSSLDLTPITGEDVIRIPFPSLTEERREKYIKIISGQTEEARQRMRDVRNSSKKKIEKEFSKGEMGEDDKYRGFDKLQKKFEEYLEKIEEMKKKKEKLIRS